MSLTSFNLNAIKDSKTKKIAKQLIKLGFVLYGNNNHLTLKSSTGAKLSISCTPSCRRAWLNKLTEIKARFGITLSI